MRLLRILALTGAALLLCVFLTACGGGSSAPPAPPSAPTVTSSQLTTGAVNVLYNGFLQESGGTGPYTWSISSGTLPPGLTLSSPSQGVISGTPTTFGKYSFTAKVTDANALSGTGTVTINIEGAIVISCVSCGTGTSNLPYGTVGAPYSASLTATGGQAPYTWTIASGALPAGLTLTTDSNGNGIISGTPTTPGPPSAFTVQATDSESTPSSGTVALTMTVMAIGTKSLATATLNSPYTGTVTAIGGQPNYTWCVLESSGKCDNGAGTLPPGLTLNTNSCVNSRTPACSITGTPTTLGNYPFTLQVSDGGNPPALATASLSIRVQGPLLQITTTSLPSGTVNLPYSAAMQATGGIPPLTWCVLETSGACDNGAGTLPAGLTMNSSGVISGTPTTSGKSGFVAQVQDSENPPQIVQSPPVGSSNELSITINPAMSDASLTGNFAFSF